MFKSIKDNKIIAINETGDFPCLVYDSVVEDTEHTCDDYEQYNGEYLLKSEIPAPPEDELKQQVRAVRNYYLSHWDFTQLDDAPFAEEEKAFYREYRQYLRNYTEQENWWLQNPDDYETWLIGNHPVTEEE